MPVGGVTHTLSQMIFFMIQDKDSGKTSVVVGTWNQEEHIEWAKKNTARAYHLQDDGTQTVR